MFERISNIIWGHRDRQFIELFRKSPECSLAKHKLSLKFMLEINNYSYQLNRINSNIHCIYGNNFLL